MQIKTISKNIVKKLDKYNGLDLVDFIEGLMDSKYDIEKALLEVLKESDDELVQTTLIDYFFGVCGEAVVFAIRDKVNSDSSLVRAYAIEFLGDIKDFASESIIRDRMILSDEEELPRIYYALIKFGYDEYLDKLICLLDYDYYRVRVATANLLSYIIDDKYKDKILNATQKQLKSENEKSVREALDNLLRDCLNWQAKTPPI